MLNIPDLFDLALANLRIRPRTSSFYQKHNRRHRIVTVSDQVKQYWLAWAIPLLVGFYPHLNALDLFLRTTLERGTDIVTASAWPGARKTPSQDMDNCKRSN